jgi:hypothetical protein
VDLVSALDRVMSRYQFHERHSSVVRATAERVRVARMAVTPDEILFLRALVWLRRLGRPLPESVRSAPTGTPMIEIALRTSFLTLAESEDESVIGTVVFAPRGGDRRPRTAAEYAALSARPGYALAAMDFTIEPRGDRCVLRTETRVYATDASMRLRFAAYWILIRPWSGLLRRTWLRAIRRRAEAAERAARLVPAGTS